MSQMTVTPVSTQGFLVDGKWIEQGELQEIRAPFDGSVIAQVFRGTREHALAAITAAVKLPLDVGVSCAASPWVRLLESLPSISL